MGHRTTKTKDKVKVHKTIDSRTDFFYYAFRNLVIMGLPLVIISGLILSHLSLHSSATSSSNNTSGVDGLSITISSACTISSVVNSAHSTNTNVGTYTQNIGKTTITTLCNDGNGYSIYANGYSNNEEGNNKLINASYPQYSIDTGLATSGLTSAWAMKLNNIPNDPSPTPPTIEQDYNDTYGLVPTYWTKVAGRTSGTTDMAQGSSFTTTYSVYAASSQYAGTYVGQVRYALLHPYRNDSTITTVPTFEDSFAISGKEKVTIDGNEYYTMQDMNSYICGRITNTGEVTTTQLVDTRDNRLYWVAKLADGHCWMTQNLDLDIGGAGVAALTSENTDISTTASGTGIYSSGYTMNNGVWTWTPDSTAVTSGRVVNYDNNRVSNWGSGSNTAPYSAEGGDTYFYTSNSDADDIKYTSLSQCTNAGHTEGDCRHYHVGNYYNFTAAIASNNSTGISVNYSQADNSICPKGWRLPIATNSDQSIYEFGDLLYDSGITYVRFDTNNLTNKINYKSGSSNKIRTTPLWFVRAGNLYNGATYGPRVYGYYWSSTVSGNVAAYSAVIYNDGIRPSYSDQWRVGMPIRCLAR